MSKLQIRSPLAKNKTNIINISETMLGINPIREQWDQESAFNSSVSSELYFSKNKVNSRDKIVSIDSTKTN
jgi:hypothetical protein